MSIRLGAIFRREQGGFTIFQLDRPHKFDISRFVFGHPHSVVLRIDKGV
jgi:hypothetical protein